MNGAQWYEVDWNGPTTVMNTGGWPVAEMVGMAPAYTKGDRVRIREGYNLAGQVFFYDSKSRHDAGKVLVLVDDPDAEHTSPVLLEAIEPHPYSHEERIERAMEDYVDMLDEAWLGLTPGDDSGRSALLFAIIEAGY